MHRLAAMTDQPRARAECGQRPVSVTPCASCSWGTAILRGFAETSPWWAAPWKQVPVRVFARVVLDCMQSVPAGRWIYVAPPGVDESRLTGSGDRTSAILDEYRDAAVSACNDARAPVVRTERVIRPLGAGAFVSYGLHLSGPAYKVVLPEIAKAVDATA